jgi:hypothetical protein
VSEAIALKSGKSVSRDIHPVPSANTLGRVGE